MPKDFDTFMKDLINERIDNIDCPPSSEVWAQVSKNLQTARRSNKVKHYRTLAAACVLMISVIIFSAYVKTPVTAFTESIISSFEKVTGGIFRIFKTGDPTKEDKDEKSIYSEIDDPRISEAQKKVQFKLVVPGYLPEGYRLEKVEIFGPEDRQNAVVFQFFNQDQKDEFIRFEQKRYDSKTEITVNIKKTDDVKVSHQTIDDVEYTIVEYGTEFTKILWDIGNISYKLDTQLPVDEAFKTVKHIK